MPSIPRSGGTGPAEPTAAARWPAILTACGLAWLAGCGGVPVKPAATPAAPARRPPATAPGTGRPATDREPTAVPAEPSEASASSASGTARAAAPPALSEAEARKLDPKVYAAHFRRPLFCEEAARALEPVSRSKAWEVLVACVEKGDFKLLERLVQPPWLEHLKTRPDAPRLIAKVIAARGGDEDRDGLLLRDHQVPVFTLEAAVKRPGVFRDQVVLLRASVAGPRPPSGEATVRLLARGFIAPSEIHVVARLLRPDPLLEPGKELLFVARFERLEERPADAERPSEWIAVLSVIGYFEPATAVVD